MTIKHQIELETTLLTVAAAAMSIVLVWHSNQNFSNKFHLNAPLVAGSSTQNIVTPIITPLAKGTTVSQVSPDGTKSLVMQTTPNSNKTITYVFSVNSGPNTTPVQIYTTTVPDTQTFSIPFNAWSPDDKYVFIQNGKGVIVFSATGEPIVEGQQYFDVASVFSEKIKTYTYNVATGWASPTLIIVNTKAEDGSKGPSYWFEVPSTAVIQLSTAF